jgi:hypothetical protein
MRSTVEMGQAQPILGVRAMSASPPESDQIGAMRHRWRTLKYVTDPGVEACYRFAMMIQ